MTAATGLTWWLTCTTCGKRGFCRRAVAKKWARQHHRGDKKRQYRCPSGGLWHNGGLPEAVIHGELTRADIRPRRSTS